MAYREVLDTMPIMWADVWRTRMGGNGSRSYHKRCWSCYLPRLHRKIIKRFGIMKEYWMELVIVAYVITSIDVMITARGIIVEGLDEGNAFLTIIFPNHSPFLVPFFTLLVMSLFWTIFYFCQQPHFEKRVLGIVSFIMLIACGTHTFGIMSWIIR
jgi:hypothetical protein